MQVVVDMRESSKTYLKWESFDLNEKNKSLILIPPGLGNAFYVKSEFAIYHYKLAYLGKYLDADEQFTVSWNDKDLISLGQQTIQFFLKEIGELK